MSNTERPDGQHQGDFPPPPPGPPPQKEYTPYRPPETDLGHTNPLNAHPTFPAGGQIPQQDESAVQTGSHQPLQEQFAPPPPTEQSHGQQDSDPPPPFDHSTHVATPLEKPPIEQQEQHFPPPPPGPPPATDHHHQAQPPEGQQQQNYSIPAYNPAAPQFAPPPTATTTTTTDQPTQQQQQQQQQQQDAALAYGASHSTPAHHHQQQQGTVPAEEKKSGWSQRFAHLGMKAAAPINSLAHKLGSQSFLPETMDKECVKAAEILKSFCKKGVYADPSAEGPPTSTAADAAVSEDGIIDPTKEKPKNRVIVTIPPKVISRAVGLAIFTTFRAGYVATGSTGSGILIARLSDGSWGPPSGIQVHTVGGGFSIGLDIYDCVCVINSQEALKAFMDTRVSLGSDLAVVAGPYGAGGAVDFGKAREGDGEKDKASDFQNVATSADPAAATTGDALKPEKDKKSHRRSISSSGLKPVFSYVKSRGFYAGIRVDGTVVTERKEANAEFYGTRVSVDQIVKGNVPPQGPTGMWPTGARGLYDTLKGAEAGLLQQGGDGGGVGTHQPTTAPPPAGNAPVASGGDGTLPAYVDDGVQRPEVGDYKYR